MFKSDKTKESMEMYKNSYFLNTQKNSNVNMRNVRFRNFQSGVCVSVKTSRVLSSIHAVANQRHTTTKLKEVRRGPRASQKGKTANPFPVFLFIYLFFFFLTRFFKLSSSVSALTERVTACAIQSIHIIGFFRLFCNRGTYL